MLALKSEGAPRAVANEPFDPDPVVALDPHGGIDAEPAARLPGEHVLNSVLLDQPALQKRPEHTLLHGALEMPPVLWCQATRFMKLHPTGPGGRDPVHS